MAAPRLIDRAFAGNAQLRKRIFDAIGMHAAASFGISCPFAKAEQTQLRSTAPCLKTLRNTTSVRKTSMVPPSLVTMNRLPKSASWQMARSQSTPHRKINRGK